MVVGVDEAGRGCLAGPLVAAAVALDYSRPLGRELAGLTDSKVLRPGVREELYARVLRVASAVSIVSISPGSVDRIGLHRSNLAALAEALRRIGIPYSLAFVDGFSLGDESPRAVRLIHGDARSAGVAAASVVAKVTRDRLMERLDVTYPDYGFARHKGYATAAHRAALRELGPCDLHRRCFAGVDPEAPDA